MNTKLLQLRNTWEKKKPTFIRQDAQKAIRLKNKHHWRKPEGMHSKMRKKLRSVRRQPSIGFSSPRAVRFLTTEGYKVIMVQNVAQLASITEPITISGTVGLRKKIEIVKKAKEKKLKVLNVKDLDKFLADAEAQLKQRKEATKSKLSSKQQKKQELIKKAEEKEKEAKKEQKEETPEEKEKQAKEEKKKILEHK